MPWHVVDLGDAIFTIVVWIVVMAVVVGCGAALMWIGGSVVAKIEAFEGDDKLWWRIVKYSAIFLIGWACLHAFLGQWISLPWWGSLILTALYIVVAFVADTYYFAPRREREAHEEYLRWFNPDGTPRDFRVRNKTESDNDAP